MDGEKGHRCPIDYCIERLQFSGDWDIERHLLHHCLCATPCGFGPYPLPFTRLRVEDGKPTGKGEFGSIDSLKLHLVAAHGASGIQVPLSATR